MIIIFQRKVPHYREKLFESISQQLPILLLVFETPATTLQLSEGSSYLVLHPTKILSLFVPPQKFYCKLRDCSCIVFEADLRLILFHVLALFFSNTPVYFWGFWFTTNPLANAIRLLLASISRGNIFYSKAQRDTFCSFLPALSKNSLIANNTLYVPNFTSFPDLDFTSREFILSIGSLQPRKNILLLISLFTNLALRSLLPDYVKLLIVGDGPMRESIEDAISSSKVSSRIIILDSVTNPSSLKAIYDKTILSVSAGQSGLSVCQSLLHSVPFVCIDGCISGGETDNIVDGISGFHVPSIAQLGTKIEDFCVGKYKYMYSSTYRYAVNNLSLDNMAKVFIDLI